MRCYPKALGDEHPASTAMLAAAATAARRMRVTVLLMVSVPEDD